MITRHPWIRVLGLTVSSAALWCGTALAGWMWDTNENRIDDRMESVESAGLAAAHVGNVLSGKLRFAVMNAAAPFQYAVYIGYDHSPTSADALMLEGIGVSAQVVYRSIPYIRSTITFAQAQQIAQLPGVTRIETIPILYATNDLATETLRARDSNQQLFPNAWDHLGATGKGVVIAILDSGVNDDVDGPYPGHESLRGKFVGGGSFFSGQPELNTPIEQSENPKHAVDPEVTYHGTHVAGTALGSGGPQGMLNGATPGFYAGVAPDARLADLKVLSDAGLGFGAADGLEWCIYHRNDGWGLTGADTIYRGVDIASLSLGGMDNSDGTDASCAAVNAAHKAGIVVMVATGNDGNTGWMASPSAADLAISVGALTDNNTVSREDDVVAGYSNEGPRLSDGDSNELDEMKPSVLGNGTGITSSFGDPTTAGDRYHHINGTSMATPAISGVVALMLSANPSLSPDQVRRILQDSAEHRTDGGKQAPPAVDPFGIDPNYHPSWGWGQADAYAAVKEALNPNSTQIVRMAIAPQASPAGVVLRWWTQREYSLASFCVDRAPDALGAPGDWTPIDEQFVATPSLNIHGAPNRHAYSFTDLDGALDPDAVYWYRVRWKDVNGGSHAEPPMHVRINPLPVLARVQFSWTHDYSDGDLDVRFGTGTDSENPVWFRQAQGAPAADSIKTVAGTSPTGTLQHFFHVDLTAEDLVSTFLPPGTANPWFLRVKEGGFLDTKGSVNSFSVTTFGPGGQTYAAPNPATPTVEKTSTVFWIPLDAALSLNHAPVLAPIAARTVGEGLPLAIAVSASDADGQTLSCNAANLPVGASFDSGTHQFSWTPSFTQAGSYTVRFTVSDGALPLAAADTQFVSLTAVDRSSGDNFAPLLDPLTDHTGIADEGMTFRASARDFEGGALTFGGLQMPSGASLDPSSGVFTWTPDEGDVGADQVTIRVTDAGGLSDEQTISLVVVRRQQAPPTVQACNGQSATLTGTVGMGTDPGEKSSTYHAFIVPPGTQNITGSLSFALAPVRDLDFYLLDADSNAVQASASVSSPEVISYTLPAPGTYYWQVLAFTNPDTAQYQIDYDLCITPVAGVEEPGAAGLRLAPPAPNPFRLSCAIRFDLPRESDVRLGVFDVSGRLIRTLQNGPMFAGRHVRSWDGATNFGARAPAGVYFYRLDARDHSGIETRTRKAVLLD